ncbi:uroporphyrinogen-III C-methyltransferase [Flintibacter muris]|uniref:uroporphyrinogen-III C-methyltransferase n=1 Tax=Flintibacter muris TaxID=2941327 RepID=UPI0020409A17|nr:uroporphyrinogen-III C-methyltransferase [Flintibacter muris]
MKGQGCVYLVGAGCGGLDLLTLRGAELLRSCDAVVYDDLIAGELLTLVPDHAEKCCMGKRSGRHSASQEEINAALISLAQSGKRVVRLKGGDPFVFGRGGEEMLALRSAGIPCEEIPGVSSAIAIPAEGGIPVTHRGISQSLHIITAHTAGTQDGLPPCLDDLARLPGTLVFLMGLSRLEQLTRRLASSGMPGDTPAAVISGGSAPKPVTVRGTLANLAERTRQAGVQSPAVIVVGGVSALDLSPTLNRPLKGVRVGLTGTSAITQKLRRALEDQGAQVFDALHTQVVELPAAFDLRTLRTGRHWIVLTSGNGVRLFFQQLSRAGVDLRELNGCRFAVIGESTGQQLWRYGIRADLCPERYTSRDLAQALLHAADPEREDILLFRSRCGAPELFQTLAQCHHVEDIPLYDLRSDPRTAELAGPQLAQADYLTFASAGGVRQFIQAYGAIPQQAVCVCIGEVTGEALRQVYQKPFLTAPEISAHGILSAILEHAAHASGR